MADEQEDYSWMNGQDFSQPQVPEYVPPSGGEEDYRLFQYVAHENPRGVQDLPPSAREVYVNRPMNWEAPLERQTPVGRIRDPLMYAPPGVQDTISHIRARYTPYYADTGSAGVIKYLGAGAVGIASVVGFGINNVGSAIEWAGTGAGNALWSGSWDASDVIKTRDVMGLSEYNMQRTLGNSLVYANTSFDEKGNPVKRYLDVSGQPIQLPEGVSLRVPAFPPGDRFVELPEAGTAVSQITVPPSASQTKTPSQAAGTPSPAAPKTETPPPPPPKETLPAFRFSDMGDDEKALSTQERMTTAGFKENFEQYKKHYPSATPETFDTLRTRANAARFMSQASSDYETGRLSGKYGSVKEYVSRNSFKLEGLNPNQRTVLEDDLKRVDAPITKNEVFRDFVPGAADFASAQAKLQGTDPDTLRAKLATATTQAVGLRDTNPAQAEAYRQLAGEIQKTLDAPLNADNQASRIGTIVNTVQDTFQSRISGLNLPPGVAQKVQTEAALQISKLQGSLANVKLKDFETAAASIYRKAELAADRLVMDARAETKDIWGTKWAMSDERKSYDWGTMFAAITTGIGLYSALVQTPKSQKDAQDFEMKMAKMRMKYEQKVWDRNVAYANSRSGGGGSSSAKRQPSAVAPVRF